MGTIDRRPYESATVLDQALLDECQDNLAFRLEMIVDIEDVGAGYETLHLSDRHKYVGDTFYEALVTFPKIDRTIGDWLAGELEFSGLSISINNADGFFNDLIPAGSLYDGFIGKRVAVKIGLGEIASTYKIFFEGEVTHVGGFQRDTTTFTLDCRNDFDRVNTAIPDQALIEDDWPDIETEFIGLGAPIIYGDWTKELRPEAPEVPMFPVNGLDPLVNASLTPPDPNAGDTPLTVVISSTPIGFLDDTTVTLRRGDEYYIFNSADINPVVGSDNQVVEITQKNLIIDGSPWVYETGDEFYCACIGVGLGAFSENPIAQGQDMLKRFGGLSTGDFHSSFSTIALKAAPPESAIANINARVWLQESQKLLSYVLSMYEQVRVELYIDRDNLFHLSTLHFEDFIPSPSFTIKNWDIVRGTFVPQTDERNQFNRAKADFLFSPTKSQTKYSSGIFRNQAAIDQSDRLISKNITFPNLIFLSDVENQVKEILKMASAYYENISMDVTSRSFLQDISDEVILDVDIGSLNFTNVLEPVTGKIREIGYNPQGMSISFKIWCFQMVPFPGSLKAGVSGLTGGSTATITKET